MGLAIDGNVVHGIAKAGQAFVSLGNVNADGSINIGGQNYFSTNKMKITDTGKFNIGFTEESNGAVEGTPIDVTSNLSNYGGYLAICLIGLTSSSYPEIVKSQPFIIPTAPTTCQISFEDSDSLWSGSLSRTTDNKFTFVPQYEVANDVDQGIGYFYAFMQ